MSRGVRIVPLICIINVPIYSFGPAEETETAKRAPITVKFEIPYFTVSGIQVRYLKIVEKSGYQALPWVRYVISTISYILLSCSNCCLRYITQHGDDYRQVDSICNSFYPIDMIQMQPSDRTRERQCSNSTHVELSLFHTFPRLSMATILIERRTTLRYHLLGLISSFANALLQWLWRRLLSRSTTFPVKHVSDWFTRSRSTLTLRHRGDCTINQYLQLLAT